MSTVVFEVRQFLSRESTEKWAEFWFSNGESIFSIFSKRNKVKIQTKVPTGFCPTTSAYPNIYSCIMTRKKLPLPFLLPITSILQFIIRALPLSPARTGRGSLTGRGWRGTGFVNNLGRNTFQQDNRLLLHSQTDHHSSPVDWNLARKDNSRMSLENNTCWDQCGKTLLWWGETRLEKRIKTPWPRAIRSANDFCMEKFQVGAWCGPLWLVKGRFAGRDSLCTAHSKNVQYAVDVDCFDWWRGQAWAGLCPIYY